MSQPPPRLDLVSPLPPVRSGIADYSLDLLPHLSGLVDLRLIRLPGQPVAPEVAAAWPLADAADLGGSGASTPEAGPDRLPLYQMGNNRYHEGVQELAMRHPGVLTLHDVVLHHLLLDVTLGRGDFYGYRERLERDHGWIGEAVAVAKRWGAYGRAPIFALPAHRTLLRRQRGVLVHSEWAAAVVREDDPELRGGGGGVGAGGGRGAGGGGGPGGGPPPPGRRPRGGPRQAPGAGGGGT